MDPGLSTRAGSGFNLLVTGSWRGKRFPQGKQQWNATRQAQDSSCLLTGMEIVLYFNNQSSGASICLCPDLGLNGGGGGECFSKVVLRQSASQATISFQLLLPKDLLLECWEEKNEAGKQSVIHTGLPPPAVVCLAAPRSQPRSFPAPRGFVTLLITAMFPSWSGSSSCVSQIISKMLIATCWFPVNTVLYTCD